MGGVPQRAVIRNTLSAVSDTFGVDDNGVVVCSWTNSVGFWWVSNKGTSAVLLIRIEEDAAAADAWHDFVPAGTTKSYALTVSKISVYTTGETLTHGTDVNVIGIP